MTPRDYRTASGLAPLFLLMLSPCLGSLGACVNYDGKTGQVIPRGKQRYEFQEVQERAKDLAVGMTKMQALLLLGAPAETDEATEVWTYLPERQAYVVPAKSLRLVFKAGVLESFGYHAIVLGQEL